MEKKKILVLCAIIGILGLTIPAFAQQEKLPNVITFASRPMGTYYVMTAGIAKVFEKQTGIKVIVETGASQYTFMPLFKTKEAQLALIGAIYIYQAYHGLDKFAKQGKTPLAYLATGYLEHFMFWTRPDTGIRTVEDMAGKTVTTKNPVSTLFEEFVRKTLESHKVWDKVKHMTRPGSNDETCQMLIEKKLDLIAMPTNTQLAQVENAVGVVPIGPGEDAIKEIVKSPYWGRALLEASKFGNLGVKKDVQTVGFGASLYTYKDLPENIAYLLVKTVYENLDELKKVQRYMEDWSPQRAVELIPIPMHRGAIKYYKEKGVWTEKQEAIQRKLLAEGQ